MEHLPDDSLRYYDRENASHLIDSFENVFIGETLIKAADYLSDLADLELHELIDLRRPLIHSIQRPDADGSHEYIFTITLADEIDEPTAAGAPFEFILVHTHSSSVSFGDLTSMQKSHLLDQIINMADVDDDILSLFSADASPALQSSVDCTQQVSTRYNCSQHESTITKTVTAHFYIGDTELTSLSFDFELNGETDETEDTTDLYANPFLLAEIGSNLAVIQPADMHELYEILYYLNLPGGVIATEVTADYADDDNRIVREPSL